MKWLIYSSIKHIEDYLYHYIKNFSEKDNVLFYYYKNLEDFDFFKPERVLLLSDSIDDNQTYFLHKAKSLNLFTALITENQKLTNDMLDSIYYVREKENFLNNQKLFNYNFTNMHLALPKILKWIKKKKKGKYNFFNSEKREIDDNEKENYILPSQGVDIEEMIVDTDIRKKINIYTPTYYRFEKTKNSILDIIELAKLSKHDIKIYIGDNNTNLDEMREWLKNIENSENMVSVYFSEENIGKANIVNYMDKNFSRKDYDYIFSIDSDMRRDTTNNKLDDNVFDKMVEILENGENIGLVASNQSELSQHWYNRTVFTRESRGYTLGYTNNGVGVSGGCIVLRKSDWDKIGGYKENHDIYTGDDSILTYNVFRILGKVAVIAHDFYLKHPTINEDEKGYTLWKQESWKRDNLNFIKDNYTGSNKKGYFD